MRRMKRSFTRVPLLPLLLAFPLALRVGCSDGGSTTSSTMGAGGDGGDGGTGGPTSSSSATASSSGGGGMGGMGGNGGAGGAGGCTPGQTAACYTGPSGTEGVGVCKAGVLTCAPDGSGFGPCEGEVVPSPESCATMADDDCDGKANEEGCACAPGSMAPCYTGPMNTQNVGPCVAGTQVCNAEGSAFGPCMGEVVPAAETCATPEDDDCDGQTNEEGANCVCVPNSTSPCYSGPPNTENVGDCKGGTKACNAQGTAYGPCVGEVVPVLETCVTPGDEDCDGQINEEGANCVCVPNTTSPCYSGPTGTEGVGICKAGTKACNAQGSAYGPCVGEVLPMQENCMTPEDENCLGAAMDPCGTPQWLKAFGDNMDQDGYAVATDTAGNVVVVGQFVGTIDFGGGPLTGAGLDDIFLVKLSSTGTHIFSKAYGDAFNQNMRGVAIGPSNAIYFTGYFEGTVDFGGGPVVANGTSDAMLVKLSSAGSYQWSKAISAAGSQVGNAVAVDSAGNVLITGNGASAIDFGGGSLPGGGANDVFLAKYDPAGAHLWSKLAGDSSEQLGLGLTVDKQNNVIISGRNSGTLNLGGGPLVTAGLNDIFLAKFNPTGAHLWSKRAGDALEQYGRGLATDAANNIFFTGRFQGTLDLGTGPVTSPGGSDIFVAKLLP